MQDAFTATEDTGKVMLRAAVVSQEETARGIYSLWLEAEPIARAARPGQFLSVYMDDPSHLLPRPLSFCGTDPQKGLVRLVYRVTGVGTSAFSHCLAGDTLRVFGPLGNGYPLISGKNALIIGGGAGIPPMLFLAKSLSGERTMVLGYRDELFLQDEFEPYGKVYIATEDGSAGTKGTVIDAIRQNGPEAGVIYACGPKPMLRAVKDYAREKDIECFISLEERMACGIGACLSCVCDSAQTDDQTNVHRKRVCRDGPVFRAGEVVL